MIWYNIYNNFTKDSYRNTYKFQAKTLQLFEMNLRISSGLRDPDVSDLPTAESGNQNKRSKNAAAFS